MTRRADLREMVRNYHRVEVAVVLVNRGETKEEAWHRHLQEHPECSQRGVRIFHFVHQELPEDFTLPHLEPWTRRKEDGDTRNPAGRCENPD